MNAKLLTEKALRDDLYIEMMYMAGTFAFYRQHPHLMEHDHLRKAIDEQINLLVPLIKRHIKRHVKVAKQSVNQDRGEKE